MPNRSFTVQQVAAELGVPVYFVYNCIRNGLFLSVRDEQGNHYLSLRECEWAYHQYLAKQQLLGLSGNTHKLSKVRRMVIIERGRLIERGASLERPGSRNTARSLKVMDRLFLVSVFFVAWVLLLAVFYWIRSFFI